MLSKTLSNILVIIILLFLPACKKKEAVTEEQPPPSVEVMIIELGNVEDTIEAAGVTQAATEVIVSAEISATIEKQFFREGKTVKTGQRLLTFDSQTFELAAASREAELARAKALFGKLTKELKRQKQLLRRGFIGEQDVEETESEFKIAKADISVSEAALKLAKRDIENTNVFTPINGLIVKRFHKDGERVTAGEPLFHIVNFRTISLIVNLSEKEMLGVNENSKVTVKIDPLNTGVFLGSVKSIGLPSNPQDGLFPVEILISNPELKIKPAMVATAVFKGHLYRNVILVPQDVVIEQLGQKAVFVVENNIAHRKIIKTGKLFGFHVQITEGIQGGEQVVVLGQELLDENIPVEIRSVHKEFKTDNQ